VQTAAMGQIPRSTERILVVKKISGKENSTTLQNSPDKHPTILVAHYRLMSRRKPLQHNIQV